MATTLGEILSAKGDADYSQGGEGGGISPDLYNSAVADEYLKHAADLQYGANRYLAEQHNLNLQNTLKGLQDVDFKDMLPADRDALIGQYTDVLQNTAGNFGAVRNPLSNPTAWAALKAKEASFRGNLSQSQQDAAYLKQQQEFVRMHPDFDSPQYQQQVQDFVNAPVGQRKYFTPTPPSIFDPASVYKAAGEASKKKYANATSNGKYITKSEGEQFDPDRFNALTAAGQLTGNDQYGRPLEQLRQNAYNSLPANIKPATYADYVAQQQKNWLPLNQQTKAEVKADEYGVKKAEFGNEMALTKYREAQANERNKEDNDIRLQIAGMKENTKAFDPNAVGAFVNKAFHDVATSTPGDDNFSAKLNAINNNPKLSPTEKIKRMDEFSNNPANYTDRAISNEILQPLYGDNTPLKQIQKSGDNTHKTDGVTTSTESTNTIPAQTVIANKLSADRQSMIVYRKNNLTGQVNSQIVPLNTFYNDLSGILGEKNAPKVQEAAREWLQKNTGDVNPDVNKLHSLFAPNTPAPATTPGSGVNVDDINKKLGDPNYQFTMPNGQTASMKDLMKHYTQDEISAGLQQGKIK